MIDVKELIQKYSIEDLNKAAEEYYSESTLKNASIKPFRLPEIKHLLTEVSHLIFGLDLLPGDRVLDFGCGTGWTSRILSACGCNVIAVDVSATVLRVADAITRRWADAEILNGPSVEFRRFDGHHLDVPDACVDKIFVLDAFHHVPDQALVLKEFARVLKPGGVAGLCEPGPNHSQHPDSQREMTLHTVIENDIVLDDVLVAARACGFGSMRVCVSPLLPMILSYEEYTAFPNNADLANQFLNTTDWRIKNYPIFFLRKHGVAALDSRGIQGLRAELQLMSAAQIICGRGEAPEIRLRVRNTGTATWLPSGSGHGDVNLGYVVTHSGASTPHREHLSSAPVPPGAVLDVVIPLPVLQAGDHVVTIDVVSELVSWFKSLGMREIVIHVHAA